MHPTIFFSTFHNCRQHRHHAWSPHLIKDCYESAVNYYNIILFCHKYNNDHFITTLMVACTALSIIARHQLSHLLVLKIDPWLLHHPCCLLQYHLTWQNETDNSLLFYHSQKDIQSLQWLQIKSIHVISISLSDSLQNLPEAIVLINDHDQYKPTQEVYRSTFHLLIPSLLTTTWLCPDVIINQLFISQALAFSKHASRFQKSKIAGWWA